MDEELQSLLTRIRSEGVEQADAQAAEIISAAQAKARVIVSSAEGQAAEIIAAAERDSVAFTGRSAKTLDQLARDFLIGVQNSLEALFAASVEGAVGEALTPETMAQMMIKLAEAYGTSGLRESRIELLVSPEDQEEFIRLVLGSYREQLRGGVEIRPAGSIHKGFRVAFPEDKLYHDFTQEAISASLSQLLKPPLREIVQRAAEAGAAEAGAAEAEGVGAEVAEDRAPWLGPPRPRGSRACWPITISSRAYLGSPSVKSRR